MTELLKITKILKPRNPKLPIRTIIAKKRIKFITKIFQTYNHQISCFQGARDYYKKLLIKD